MRDEQCSVVAKGVYAYAHTFWDNDDEDGERESKEERRNRMNGKGEGEGRGDETASALMRSGDMRTRRGQEENCYASEDCSAHFPGPTVIIHAHTTPHAGNVTQNRHGSEAA